MTKKTKSGSGSKRKIAELKSEIRRLIKIIRRMLENEEHRKAEHGELKREVEMLRREATTDSLVKDVLNRRGFFEGMKHLLSGIHRGTQHSATLVYVDLDKFKPINELCGHHAGDIALMKFGHILKTSLRSSDYVARVGGDEFAIVLKKVGTRKLAEYVMEKVRKKVSVITLEHQVEPAQLRILLSALNRKHLLDFSAGYHVIRDVHLNPDTHLRLAEEDILKYKLQRKKTA